MYVTKGGGVFYGYTVMQLLSFVSLKLFYGKTTLEKYSPLNNSCDIILEKSYY